MSVPGMPSDYGAKQIQEERSGQIITRVRHCVSREEALDARLIFSAGDKTCQFPRFAMTGGKIDVQLVCPNGAQTETRTLTGNYTPTSISVDMLSRVTGGPRSGATMKMHFDAKRIGPCSEADG